MCVQIGIQNKENTEERNGFSVCGRTSPRICRGIFFFIFALGMGWEEIIQVLRKLSGYTPDCSGGFLILPYIVLCL